MKYRSHRGGLDESMATVVEVVDKKSFLAHVRNTNDPKFWTGNVTWKLAIFDERIGWDTWNVMIGGNCVGMTNGDPEDLPWDVRYESLRDAIRAIYFHDAEQTSDAYDEAKIDEFKLRVEKIFSRNSGPG